MCLLIEIGRDADGDVAPVEEVNINHCNHNNVQVCGLSQQTREESVDLFEQSFSDMVWDPVQVFVSVKDGF